MAMADPLYNSHNLKNGRVEKARVKREEDQENMAMQDTLYDRHKKNEKRKAYVQST